MVTAIESIRQKLHLETLFDNLRRARRAGLGAVVILQEEIGGIVDRMVTRGEAMEKDGLKVFDKFFAARKEQAKKTVGEIEKVIDTRLDQMLTRMNLITRKDLESLKVQLEDLADKVEKLGGGRKATTTASAK